MATLTTLGGVTSDWFRERVQGLPWFACLITPLVIYAAVAKQVWFKTKDKRQPKKQS
jgi:hypothetical protein